MKSDIVTNDLHFLRIDDAGHTNNNNYRSNSVTTIRTNSLPLKPKSRDCLPQENGHLLLKNNSDYYSKSSTSRQRKAPTKLPQSSNAAVQDVTMVDYISRNSPSNLIVLSNESNKAPTNLWMSLSSNHTSHPPLSSTKSATQSPSRSPWGTRATYTSSPNSTLPYKSNSRSNHRLVNNNVPKFSQQTASRSSRNNIHHTVVSSPHSPLHMHSAMHGVNTLTFNDFNFNSLDRDRKKSPNRRNQTCATDQLFLESKQNYGAMGVTHSQVQNLVSSSNNNSVEGNNSNSINNNYSRHNSHLGVMDFGVSSPSHSLNQDRLPRHSQSPLQTTVAVTSSPLIQHHPPMQPHSSPQPSPTPAPQSQQQQIAIRVALFGYQGVGKSSIILQFIRNRFRRQYIPTIEDTYQKEIDTQSGPKVIGVTDTNGSFQFPAMQRKTIHQSNVILLVFSITNKQSFEFLARVHDDICRCGKPKPIILVGNKCDEQSSRQVTQAQALAHAKSWGCPYVETSAKDNINIQDVFLGAARLSFEDGAATQHKNNNIGNQNSNSRRRERLKQQSGDAQTGDTPSGCCHVCCCIS